MLKFTNMYAEPFPKLLITPHLHFLASESSLLLQNKEGVNGYNTETLNAGFLYVIVSIATAHAQEQLCIVVDTGQLSVRRCLINVYGRSLRCRGLGNVRGKAVTFLQMRRLHVALSL